MIKVKKFETKWTEGAQAVLINYLDGALADYEAGNDDEGMEATIKSCIDTLDIISDSYFGRSVHYKYRERFEQEQEKRNYI